MPATCTAMARVQSGQQVRRCRGAFGGRGTAGMLTTVPPALVPTVALSPIITRVEQHVFADAHASASVNRDPPLQHHGCGQALAQVGRQAGMSVNTCKAPSSGAVPRRSPDSSLLRSALIRRLISSSLHHGRGGETRPPSVSFHANSIEAARFSDLEARLPHLRCGSLLNRLRK
jgi:hypothetical protein